MVHDSVDFHPRDGTDASVLTSPVDSQIKAGLFGCSAVVWANRAGMVLLFFKFRPMENLSRRITARHLLG